MDTNNIQMGLGIKFNIYDFSGNYDLSDPLPPEEIAIENCGLMIFVIDGQAEPYNEAVEMFVRVVQFIKKRVQNC